MAIPFDAVWNGSVSSLFTVAANWTPANVPTQDEDIFVPASTPSIDATGIVDEQYGIIHVARGYTGDLGASGTPLESGFTDIRMNGSGKFWHRNDTKTTNRIIVNAPGNSDAMNTTGTITTVVVVLRGTMTLAGDAGVLPLLEVGFMDNRATDARVVLAAGANAVTRADQWGGAITSTRTITELNQHAGECIQNVGYAITTGNIGGRLDYRSNTTLGTLRLFGGGVGDFTKERKSTLTITTAYRYPMSTLLRDRNIVEIGTEYDWRN